MHAREATIIEAAFCLFAHYGVSKTSMSEIASAAGVARQTVYNAFASKEDLIFAAFLHYASEARNAVESECATVLDLSGRLDIVFRHLVEKPYEVMLTLPHLEEVLEIEQQLSSDRRAEVKELYQETIRTALSPYKGQLEAHGVSLDLLAAMLKSTITQIKRDAADAAHLKQLFGTAKAIICAAASDKAN